MVDIESYPIFYSFPDSYRLCSTLDSSYSLFIFPEQCVSLSKLSLFLHVDAKGSFLKYSYFMNSLRIKLVLTCKIIMLFPAKKIMGNMYNIYESF